MIKKILCNLKYISCTFLLLVTAQSLAQDGVLDTTFGVNGITKTDINSLYDVFSAIAVQDDGKIIAVGHTSSGSTANKESIVVRYNIDGDLDTTFGTNGIIVATFSTAYDTLNAVKLQDDGKIVVAGFAGLDFLIARYTVDGQLDASFGTNGVVFTDYHQTIVGSTQDRINCIAIQGDGKIIVGGYAKYFSNYPYAIARYNVDGTLDNSFGLNGRTILNHNFNLASGYKELYDIVVAPNGKIYAVGEARISSSHKDQTIVRYNSDGSLDDTFANNGERYFDLNIDSKFEAIKLQDDGKLVVVGNRGVAITVVRLSENAVLDTSFSNDGRDTPSIGASASFGKSVLIQPDGKIIISGNMSVTGGAQSVIIRYLSDGNLDTTFASTGILNFFVGDGYQGGSFSAFQPDGKLIVGGDFNDSVTTTTDLYLFRLTTGVLSINEFDDSKNMLLLSANPIKDFLKLNINLKADTLINIDLYDISGKKITTLLRNTEVNGGNHDFNFNLSNFILKQLYLSLKSVILLKQ